MLRGNRTLTRDPDCFREVSRRQEKEEKEGVADNEVDTVVCL